MSTRQKDRRKPLGVVGSVSRSAGTVVGTVAATGKRIAVFGVKGAAVVRRNILGTRVAADEKPGKKRQGKQAKIKKKAKKPKSSSRPRKRPASKAGAKTKVAIRAQKPRPRATKAKVSGDKSDKSVISIEPEAKIHRPQSEKTGVETKVAIGAQKPQPRVAKAKTSGGKSDKTAGSTKLKTKIRRLENEMEDLKYPPVDLEDEYFDG